MYSRQNESNMMGLNELIKSVLPVEYGFFTGPFMEKFS